jgi:hypothetical protein
MDDKEKAESVWELSSEVASYAQLKSILDLGLTVSYDKISYDKVLIYSWIKEALENGRKN